MIRLNATDIKPYIVDDPQRVPSELIMKVLLSPAIQANMRDIGMGMTIYPPHSRNIPHRHQGSQEIWFVVSGRGEMIAGGERWTLEPDTVVVAPPGVEHHIVNPFAEELKVIWMFTPPGPEQEFIG